MKSSAFLLVMTVLGVAGAGYAFGADIARLEWGGFVVEDDSSDGWDTFQSLSSDDGRSVEITFSSLDAKADGPTKDAKARLAGHYDLSQPVGDRVSHIVATVEGHVIKSGDATTRLVLKVGSEEKIVEWPAGSDASEKFKRDIEITVPADGRLPDPFAVSVETYARKNGAADAAYLSVDALTITAADAPGAQATDPSNAGSHPPAGRKMAS